jgi:hypothetical protein
MDKLRLSIWKKYGAILVIAIGVVIAGLAFNFFSNPEYSDEESNIQSRTTHGEPFETTPESFVPVQEELSAGDGFDFGQLGSFDNPTTDSEKLIEALEVLGQKSIQNRNGWLHFQYKDYNPSSDRNHPFYSNDGYSYTDMWYDVNETGTIERVLGIKTDLGGNELQVFACGEGICGNLSMIRMGDDYPGPAIGEFSPAVRPSSTKGIINEIISGQDHISKGWVENGEYSQILYIAQYFTSPEREGSTQIVLGFEIVSGELAYYGNFLQDSDESLQVILEQRLVVFENLGKESSIEAIYADIMAEIKEGD